MAPEEHQASPLRWIVFLSGSAGSLAVCTEAAITLPVPSVRQVHPVTPPARDSSTWTREGALGFLILIQKKSFLLDFSNVKHSTQGTIHPNREAGTF